MLNSLKTEYIETEDRVRISGATADGSAVFFWLTRRLLERLIPLMVQWMERHNAKLPHLIAFSFMHQTVQPDTRPLAVSWLVNSIEISSTNDYVKLTFKGAEGQSAAIQLAAPKLRQWIEILHESYLAAQWPLDVWPKHLLEQASTSIGRESTVWH
jgi:hypothetical protein